MIEMRQRKQERATIRIWHICIQCVQFCIMRTRVTVTHDVKRLFVGIAIDVKWSEMFSDSRSGECDDAGRPRALVHRVLLRTEHIQILLVEQAISFAPSSGRRSGSDFLFDPSLAGAGSWLHFRRRNGVA